MGNWTFRSAYALVGVCDMGPGTGVELYSGDVASDATAFIDTTVPIVDGSIVGAGRAAPPRAWVSRNSGFVGGAAWTTVPGLVQTFDLYRPSNVFMEASGVQRYVTGSYCHVGYRYVVDGVAQGNGSWGNRIEMSTGGTWHHGFNVEDAIYLEPGTHTIELQARNIDGTNVCNICAESNGALTAYDSCIMRISAGF